MKFEPYLVAAFKREVRKESKEMGTQTDVEQTKIRHQSTQVQMIGTKRVDPFQKPAPKIQMPKTEAPKFNMPQSPEHSDHENC